MSLRLAAVLLAGLLVAGNVTVAGATPGVQPMTRGSLAKIVAARRGQPFIVAYWSVTCAHCPRELRALGELRQRYPQLQLVLVSTDTPEDAGEAARLAAGYGLGDVEQWVFAEAAPEILRAEIDSRWHGELPRTAFYDRQHRVEAFSGVVSAKRLQAWAEAHAR